MTEQELSKQIAEILEATKQETGCNRRSGRQYRRMQSVKHSDHTLFLMPFPSEQLTRFRNDPLSAVVHIYHVN